MFTVSKISCTIDIESQRKQKKENEVLRITMIKPDQEQLLTNLVIAEDLVDKAKKYLIKGTIDVNDYNNALKYASKFIIDSQI